MSTSSGAKNRPPAHQNAFAFRHNRRSALTDRIDRTVDTKGLCEPCARKIEWRKKYRKYKPLTVPRRCNRCHHKRVLHAYHTLCSACAQPHNVCAVCVSALAQPVHEPVDMADVRVAAVLESLSERERRTVVRLTSRGVSVSEAMRKIGLTLVQHDRRDESHHQHPSPDGSPSDAQNVAHHTHTAPIASQPSGE